MKMFHDYVVNYLVLSFFSGWGSDVVSALPITFMFRKGIEACWVLTRKIEKTKKQNRNGNGRDTNYVYVFVRELKPVEFWREK